MSETRVVNRRADAYDVYIGRPGKWGNPFMIGKDGSRAEVLAKYRTHVLHQGHLLCALEELRGKRLGCWCAPLPCHGDVLVELLATDAIIYLTHRRACERLR